MKLYLDELKIFGELTRGYKTKCLEYRQLTKFITKYKQQKFSYCWLLIEGTAETFSELLIQQKKKQIFSKTKESRRGIDVPNKKCKCLKEKRLIIPPKKKIIQNERYKYVTFDSKIEPLWILFRWNSRSIGICIFLIVELRALKMN